MIISIFAIVTSIVAAIIDMNTKTIPNKISVILFIGGIANLVYIGILKDGFILFEFLMVLLNSFLASMVALMITMICRRVSSGGLGMGDVKFLTALAFLLGVSGFLKALAITSCVAFSVAAVMMAAGCVDKKSTLPFAPFIAVGVCASTISEMCIGGII